jgi:hypothetical protein
MPTETTDAARVDGVLERFEARAAQAAVRAAFTTIVFA